MTQDANVIETTDSSLTEMLEHSLKELLEQRQVERTKRSHQNVAARDADLAVMRRAVDVLLESWRCESHPELLLMPVPRFLFAPAYQQGRVEGKVNLDAQKLNLKIPLHNLLSEILVAATREPSGNQHSYDQHLQDGFLLLPEAMVRPSITDSWLLDMDSEKLAPTVYLDGNVPFIRCFASDNWGMLFPEKAFKSVHPNGGIHYQRINTIWQVKYKFRAVKIALALATQKPKKRVRYVLPKGQMSGFAGWFPEKMFG